MPANQKIVPVSPNSSSSYSSAGQSEKNLEGIPLNSFKLKPAGTGATRNTLVENDSLSSYSWPEETNYQNGGNQQAGVIAVIGASRDSSENGKHAAASTARKGTTVLEIENDENAGPSHEPTYVEAYMKFMYWTCVSPFNPMTSRGCRGSKSRSDFFLNVIQKILFSTVVGLSFINSFFEVKFFMLWYMTFPDMEGFIDMMYHVMNTGTKVYYVYLFVMLQKHQYRMLTSLDKLRTFRMLPLNSESTNSSFTMRYAIKLGISSIVLSVVQTIWHSPGHWSLRDGIMHHSLKTALGLLVWSKENMSNDTRIITIKEEYNEQRNMTTFILGAFGITIHFFSGMLDEVIADLMQTQAETVREEMQCLQDKINITENDDKNLTLAGLFRENGEWAHARLLTQAINACNDTLDPLMKYKHVNNLMLYVFFVLNFFDGDYSVAYLAYLLYGICKSSYTYRIAAEASTLNDSKRDWICRLAWKSNDNEFLKKVPLLLVEIKAKPIGMGRGQFMINESFLYRFLGWVGSVFVLQAQSRESKSD